MSEEKNLLEPTNLNKSPVEQHQHQSALVEEKQATEGDDERFQENQSKYFESKENNFQSPEDQEIFAQMKQLAQEKNGVNEGTKLEEAQVKANEYYLYLKLKREREEEKRIAAEKRKEEDLRLIKENPKIIHISEDKAKLIPEKKAKLSHDSVNKNVSKLNKKNRIKRELEKKEEHREVCLFLFFFFIFLLIL